VAARGRWPWAAPAASAAGVGGVLVGGPPVLAGSLLAAGTAVLAAVLAVAHRRHAEAHLVVMVGGAVAGAVAGVAWAAGMAVPRLVPLLAAFLVLTIAAERLELARLSAARGRGWLLLWSTVVALGGAVAAASPVAGARVAGAGILGTALWLVRRDVARRTVRLGGLPRYVAAALLAGYAWAGFAGALWIADGLRPGPGYDAAVHALFLGFVMSLVLGHGPIVLPALSGLSVPYRPALWGPLGLLHGSLLLRVVGDLAGWPGARRWGGLLGAVTLGAFVVVVAGSVLAGRRRAGR